MNYQIQCLCGHRFAVPATQLGRHVPCPQCQRALVPVLAQPESQPVPPAAPPAAAGPETLKRCPLCGETILAIARKCKHCGEYLDPHARPSSPGQPAADPARAADGASPAPSDAPVFALSISQWDNAFRYLACAAIVILAGIVLFGQWTVGTFRWQDIVGHYSAAIFTGILLTVALAAYFIYLGTRSARCLIRPNRIETEVGIFSKKVDSLEIFRITDVQLQQSFLERLLGIGTIAIKSTDPSTPTLELYQIPQARKVHKYLLDQVPKADQARGVVRVER